MDDQVDTQHFAGTSFMRGLMDFETSEGIGDGGGGTAVAEPPAVPSVDTSLFTDPPQGEQPGGEQAAPAFDPAELEQRLREGLTSDLGELFRSSLATPPPTFQQPAAQPAVQPGAQPQTSRLEAALANYDAFNPQSVNELLTAQAADLEEKFEQRLQEMRGEYAPMVSEHVNTQGEQMAKAELSSFEPHIGFAFDHDDAINAARNLLSANPEMSERDALWYGANQVAQKERSIGMRYVQAYREHLNTLAGAGEGEPAPGPAQGELEIPADDQGPGKYARRVKARMAADRSRQAATV